MFHLLVALLLLVSFGQTNAGTFSIKNQWSGGFEGWISIPVTTSSSGWTIRLALSKAVSNLQIWDAVVSQVLDGGATYVLVNQGYNANILAGKTLEMNFIADASGGPPTGSASLVTSSTTSTAATTQSSTTTTTSSTTTTTSSATTATTTKSPAGKYNYGDVIAKSILFYEAQRSGKLPANNRVSWRKDSALGDKGQKGEDLTGGWYDAGDYVKFNFAMASSATLLLWGILEFEDGYRAAGEYNNAVDSVKWALDYFIKCHVSDNELYGQVGDGDFDHKFWGRPEDMDSYRPAWKIDTGKPGSDLAGETAAAFAAGYLVFKNTDNTYASNLLSRAKKLYNFAYSYRGKYSDAISNAASFYGSSGYNDELCWGALWLYKATGDSSYLNKAKEFLPTETPWAQSWDSKYPGALVLLKAAGVTQTQSLLESYLKSWFPGGSLTYSPKGLAWRDQWGSLRYSANTALVALIAAEKGVLASESRAFATKQINYMLGDAGRSFVVGFGNNPPKRPHHASSSCKLTPATCGWNDFNSADANPQTLYGALVGGPNQYDSYTDSRDDYISNEVACDYNAGFQGALAEPREALQQNLVRYQWWIQEGADGKVKFTTAFFKSKQNRLGQSYERVPVPLSLLLESLGNCSAPSVDPLLDLIALRSNGGPRRRSRGHTDSLQKGPFSTYLAWTRIIEATF